MFPFVPWPGSIVANSHATELFSNRHRLTISAGRRGLAGVLRGRAAKLARRQWLRRRRRAIRYQTVGLILDGAQGLTG
jgi:hypothetical protein